MKHAALGLFLSLMTWSPLAIADSGVVLEVSGDVRLKLPSGQTQVATKGKRYPDGTAVITGATGRAVIVTEFGQMFRVGPNTNVAIGNKEGDTAAVSLSQGMILALRESMGGPQGGPRAHGAVKGLGGGMADTKMTKKSLEQELKEVEKLPVESTEARAMIKGQIFYRYREYQRAVEVLLPVYRANPQAAFVRELLAKSYEGAGRHDEAAKL